MITKGKDISVEAVMQPDRAIIEKNDGLLEGSITFTAAVDNLESYDSPFPEIDEEHPDDDRLECYNLAYTFGTNSLVTCVASYIGIVPKKFQVDYSASTNSEPIETHPLFENKLAGTASSPKNDAIFDEDTEEFIGFPKGKFQGVSHYLVPAATLSMSFWLDESPLLNALMSVYPNPLTSESRTNESGIKLPSKVGNWMLVSAPVRKVGNFWQVTEQWLASGEDGWNAKIYPKQSLE